MLVSAWDALSTETIVNCFRKSGISTESQETTIAEDDDPFRELKHEIDDLRSVKHNLIDATTFADVDVEVIVVQPPPSDAEIVAQLLEMEDVNVDDDDYSSEVTDELVKCSDKNELLKVIETLQRLSLFLNKGDTIQSYTSRIESQVDQHFPKKKKKKKHTFMSKVLNKKCF